MKQKKLNSHLTVVCGSGKGKTTYSLGIVARTVFSGKKAAIIQFMKGYPYSEVKVLQKLEGVTLYQTGTPDFVKKGYPAEIDLNEAERGIAIAESLSASLSVDLLLLDEINVAVDYGLIAEKRVTSLIASSRIERVIFTGRYPSERILSMADAVLSMEEIKHPFVSGIIARRGIDY